MTLNSAQVNDFLDEDEEQKVPKPEIPDPLTEKFTKTRQILLTGEVNKELGEKDIRQLLVMESDSDKPVYVFIDSPGGDVDAGYAIFDMIRFINAPVWTVGMGLVASAGSLIALAAPKERRVALPNSHFLIHQPSSGFRGAATDIEIHAAEIEKIRERINKLIAEETGKSMEQVTKDTDRDHWLSAQEALDYGLVSKIISSRKELA
jgi:ATP-dependent Clp protease protease subunit